MDQESINQLAIALQKAQEANHVKTLWDNPGIQQFIGNLPLLIIGLIALIIVLKHFKDVHLKKGDTEIDLKAAQSEIIKPVVKVMTEYADWKSEYQKEYTKDFASIDAEAKQTTVTAIQGHLSVLTQKYNEVINASKQPKKSYTTRHFFTLFIAAVYPKMLDLTLTIYEQNHLHDKTEEYLEELMERRYEDLRNIYRELIQRYWFNDLLPYQDLIGCLKENEAEFKGMLRTVVKYYKGLSDKKFELNQRYSKLDVEVKTSVNEEYKLPLDAYVKLHDLYNPII